MSPGKVLQPVLKMKVDELFLCWLSQPATQLTLKDCLRRIKNEEKTEIGNGESGNGKNERFANKNSSSSQCLLGDTRLPLMSFSPPQLSTTLPLATPATPRNISNVRATRRSSGTKVVSLFLTCLYKWKWNLYLWYWQIMQVISSSTGEMGSGVKQQHWTKNVNTCVSLAVMVRWPKLPKGYLGFLQLCCCS